MPRARIGGRVLAWREAGRGEPALLSHCALAHSGAFAPLMERLGDRLAMRALDLPGHGGTEYDPGRRLQEQAVADLMALLPDEPAHLIGHSFGGTAALRLAVEQPDRVRTLTLIEPVFFALLAEAGHPAYYREIAEQAPFHEAAEVGDWERAATLFLDRWGSTGAAATRNDYILARMPVLVASEADILWQADPGLRLAQLRGLAVPVLLIDGERSPSAIGAILDTIEAELPAARRVRVAGAGHMLPLTHAEAVSGVLRDFLDRDRGE